MKAHVWKDERYPNYGFHPARDGEKSVEISDELLAELDAAEAAYTQAQGKLHKLYEQQK